MVDRRKGTAPFVILMIVSVSLLAPNAVEGRPAPDQYPGPNKIAFMNNSIVDSVNAR